MNPYIYPQSTLLTNIRTLLKEASAERWTDAEIYQAMNMALTSWQGRVRTPHIYTIVGGWVAGTYSYTLPTYIDTRTIQPQARYPRYSYIDVNIEDREETWNDIVAFDVEPVSSSGAMALRLHYSNPTYAVDGASNEGRVIHWAEPGPVPTTLPTLSAGIDADDTSLVLASKPTVGRAGYVKVNSEWIGYTGFTEGSSTLTLNNLVRGLNETTAASHISSDTVTWGVGVDTPSLLNTLYDGTRMYLMDIYLSNPSSRETAQYEKQLVLFQDRLDRFWKGYRPSRPVRIRLSRQAMGSNI